MAYEDILAAVDAGRLMDCVRAICTGERLSNEAEVRAFDVLEKLFTDAGCRVTREALPGYVSTPEGASFEVGGIAYEVLTHPMTPSAEGLEADLVYVPVDRIGSASAEDVSGRIVLTDGLAMEPVVRALEGKGAAAVVFITGEETHNMIVSRVWGSPTPETLGDYVGIPVASLSFGDGSRIRGRLADAGGRLPAKLSTCVRNRWTDIPVIAADIPGPDKDFVMMTGHVDSWGLGALDNASGNACAVELARIFAPLAGRMRRGVRFVLWSGHSHGRYAGSTAYCDAHFEELQQHCLLNVNADCLGGRGATVMTESPAMASTRDLARTALREAAGVTDWRGCRYTRSCDQSFWGPGVPTVFSQVSEQPPFKGAAADAFGKMFGNGRSGGFGAWWHTKSDTPDKLDPENLARDVRVFASVLAHVLLDEVFPVDARAEVLELREQIEAWQKKAGGELDLSETVERLGRLAEALDAARLSDDPARFARRSHRVLNAIIPLGYVEGSIFSHDEALRAPAVPMLRLIDDLPSLPVHDRNAALVKLRRAANRLKIGAARALEEACA